MYCWPASYNVKHTNEPLTARCMLVVTGFGKRVWQCGIVPIYSLRPPCCPQSDSHTSHVEGGFARCVHIAAMVC
eukprot:7863872-Pyramimonas_sp.AAC.1